MSTFGNSVTECGHSAFNISSSLKKVPEEMVMSLLMTGQLIRQDLKSIPNILKHIAKHCEKLSVHCG